MPSPQLENGYVKIANEIFDKLCCFRIPGEVMLIVNCIIRETWGYNKKEDKISGSQFTKMTGMKKQNVHRASSKAITHKLVIQSDDKWRLNKNCENWISFKSSSKVITFKSSSKVITRVIQSDDKSSSKVITPIYIKDTSKDTIKDRGDRFASLSPKIILYKRKPVDQQTPQLRICYFYEDCLKTSIVNWAKEITAASKMLKAGYTEKQIILVIKQMKQDQFYQDKFFDLMTVANQIPKYKAKAQASLRRSEVNNVLSKIN